VNNVNKPNNIHIFIGTCNEVRTIFVNATVNPNDYETVQKKVSKAFIADSLFDKDYNTFNYINKHDYLNWILNQTRRMRKEIAVNLTADHFIYPVSVDINYAIDVESPFWADLIKRFEPIQDWKVVVSISEKAAFMLNGQTFAKFFNHPEFSAVISDVWECGPQLTTKPDVGPDGFTEISELNVWEYFLENCKRHLKPIGECKHKRFYVKPNSDKDYTFFLQGQGIDFEVIPFEYFLFDTNNVCGIKSSRNMDMMDWEDAMDYQPFDIDKVLESIWHDDKEYDALLLNRVPKQHRLSVIAEAETRGLLDNMIWSCGYETDNMTLPGDDPDVDKKVLSMLPKQAEFEPHDNISGNEIPIHHDRKFNLKWPQKCKINIITESQARDLIIDHDPPHPVRFLTEKTFKAMAWGMPFLFVGNQHGLQRLRDLGFKTFPEWFDESYDELDNYNLRIKGMFDAYEKFLSEEHSIDEIQNSLEHNFNKIHDSFWVSSRLVDPMRIIIDRIEEMSLHD
tara:strand:- start:5044 stop:6570 length:1527 start_codon:yes stop_codon:yes gene_type:complete